MNSVRPFAMNAASAASVVPVETEREMATSGAAATNRDDGGDAGATVPSPEIPQTDLLRSWSQTPVAPAVVLEDEGVVGGDGAHAASREGGGRSGDATSHNDDQSHGSHRIYSYPVATFVSNLVRSSVSEIRGHFSGSHVYAAAAAVTDDGDDDAGGNRSAGRTHDANTGGSRHSGSDNGSRIDPRLHMMSVRSEPPILATATTPPLTAYMSSAGEATVRSLSNMDRFDDTESAEFVLIDGDLIALPFRPSAIETEDIDLWNQRNENFLNQSGEMPKNCRPNRMGKVSRSIRKWMKKKKIIGRRSNKHNHNQTCDQSQQQQRQNVGSTLPSLDQTRLDIDQASEQFSVQPSLSNEQDNDTHQNRASYRRQYSGDDDSVVPTSFRADDDSPARPGTGADSSFKRGKMKRKRRIGWRRDNDEEQHESAPSASLPRQKPSLEQQQISRQQLDPQQHQWRFPMSPPSLASMPLHDESSYDVGTPTLPPFPTVAAITSLEPLSPNLYPPSIPAAAGLSQNRSAGIAAEASFVGNADQVLEADVLAGSIAAEAYIEDRLDDYDKYDKKDSINGYPYLQSVIPRDTDYKVDKQDAPCVDTMLQRAEEYTEDLEASTEDSLPPPPKKLVKGKSDGSSVPLSMATSKDELVHNDVLKVVMVGAPDVDKNSLARALRKTTKKPRKRSSMAVDVHSWSPLNNDQIKFTIWDVQGAHETNGSSNANFGAHPGTQSLFFSDRTLYLLVWDLALSNRKTHRRMTFEDDTDEEDEDLCDNEYLREEAYRQADRALQTDIEDRVLSWVDCVARRGPNSAILPIALVPSGMCSKEIKRRCDMMQMLLMDYTQQKLPGDLLPPKVIIGSETMICVSLETSAGIDQLEETVLAIATDSNHSVFDHVGTLVPPGTVLVLEASRRMKSEHKMIMVDHLMAELDDALPYPDVVNALHFLSSIGEVLYFGDTDDILSRYVILSRKWLVSAISCILRNDLERELSETRRFMNMQCIYSDQHFEESIIIHTFSTNTSNCPLLSSTDTQMLWQSMNFMREAADKSAQLNENSTTTFTMFGFLERLLVHTGVFLPLNINDSVGPEVYFVPSLLSRADTRGVWTFKSSESWMTTLSHSWLFRDGAPVGLMEHLTVALLRDLYEFSHTVAKKPQQLLLPRSQTYPFAHDALSQFIESHDGEVVGRIKIHQIMCWRSCLLIKIGCVFPDGNEFRESFVEVFVAIADQSSPHCVASDAMRSSMTRLVVSGKGQDGHHGRKLWKGGYALVVDSVKASLAHCTNVDRQVVCPECLAHAHQSSASTWSWDSVRAAAETGSSLIRCMRGHRVDANLICGSCRPLPRPDLTAAGSGAIAPKKPVRELLPSIVVVGLWDAKSKSIRNVGSGFIVDKKQGLIVTAGHILFQMEEGRYFGTPYFGLKHAKAVVGVIPENGNAGNDVAVFRYFAEIVAEDIHSVDACVLRITTRMENDADCDSQLAEQPEQHINIPNENLTTLKMTRRFELEEAVRILGFNQGGEGLLEQGKHVNRSADFAKGYICKQFKMSDDNSHSSSGSSNDSSSGGSGFSPREEIVIMCPTISGHSGGPCVNDEGKVIGILSRADPVDRQRCYLVPSNELKTLVTKAKKNITRGLGGLKLY